MKYISIIIILFFSLSAYSLDINEAIKSTIENNPKVKIAIEKLNESKELIENAQGKKLPSLTGTISGTYANSDSSTTTGSSTAETLTDKYKISLTQNIFDGGNNNLEITRSKILYDNEIIYFKKTIQDLILTAINGYLTVISYEKSLDANKKNFDSVSRFLEETNTRFDLGSATLYDLQNAESAYALAETSLFTAQQNYDVSKIIFKRIVGLEAFNLEEIVDFSKDLKLNMIIDKTLMNNYDLLLLNNEILNNKILLQKEKNSNKLSLDLSASAEYSDAGRIDNGTEKTNGTIGLTLTIPIFQQNIDKSDIRKQQSQLLQAEISYQDTIEEIQIQASNLFKDYLVSKSNIASNVKRIKSIQTSLDSIKEEYNIGTKTITELIEAETELLTVNVNYYSSRKDFILNYFNILALEGSIIELFDQYLPNYN
ncbi:MAG: Outer membrane protein TolC [Alphaproteobacteria bacterium MarineAlpha5_Bin5]|nr:MAG: Outer membrane protein TolC [Alphaproteobacteria bacterium MarineAlpha5_Bin5]PPR52094.1 MAG: Outer membrane protein TolC [Alphaproteobacteria bacterium MarineAlpha5_Bin4]|tara:strand:+ start:831 stop:2114 length:1284 start_codon:yes stop_codon:yes gene_type:complete